MNRTQQRWTCNLYNSARKYISTQTAKPIVNALVLEGNIVKPDQPPAHNIRDVNSVYIKGLLHGIKGSQTCLALTSHLKDLSDFQRAILTDNKLGLNWAAGLYTAATMSYMDKSFYQCITGVLRTTKLNSIRAMLVDELVEMSNSKTNWTVEKVTRERPTVVRIDQCLQGVSGDFEKSIQRVAQDFKVFESMVEKRSPIFSTDTPEQRKEIINKTLHTYCSEYVLPPDVKISESNALNVGASLYELSLVMTAKLCGDRILSCMNHGKPFHECITDPLIFECYKR